MAQPLTDIANRLTPSVPLEFTFGSQPVAIGKKFTTLFGHMSATPGTGVPYQVYTVTNVGDPAAAKAEVDALAGVGSQISLMAQAFVQANVSGGFGNFPAFRVVLIPNAITNFGPNQEAINAVKFLRTDMFVSCYPASDATNAATLLALTQLVSGIDRDLQGQFGSFMTLGSLDPLATAEAYAFNSRYVVVAYLQDSNTATVPITGTTTTGSPILTAVSQPVINISGDTHSSTLIDNITSTAGIYPGATITGSGVAPGTTVYQVLPTSLIISAATGSSLTATPLAVTNLPTAGIYPGAVVTVGTGVVGFKVLSVAASTITLDTNALSSNAAEPITLQNKVSQPSEIVAAAHAAGMMGEPIPYVPLSNVTIGGLIPPRKTSDWIPVDPNGSSEACLAAGLSPLMIQPGGTVAYIRTRTTYVLNGVVTVTSYFDWQDLVKMNDFREAVFQITQQPPFNNNPGGSMASAETAALLKDEVLAEAQFFEDNNMFQGVKTLAPLFIVQPSVTSRGRFDFKIPINVLPGLQVIAGNIEGVSGLNFGDFTL